MAKNIFGDEVASEDTNVFGDTTGTAVKENRQPLEPDEAFDRAGAVWDISAEAEMPISAVQEMIADPSDIQDMRLSTPEIKKVGFAQELKDQWLTQRGLMTKTPFFGALIPLGEAIEVTQSAGRLNGDFDYTKSVSKAPPRDPRISSEFVTSVHLPVFHNREADVKIVEDYIERVTKNRTFLAKVAAGASVMPTWMVEFALTGGLASIGKEATKKGMIKLLNNYAKTKAGQVALRAAGWTGGAITRTTVGLSLQVSEKTFTRQAQIKVGMRQDEGWATSFAMAWGEVVIESASEEAGAAITKGASKLLRSTKFGAKLADGLQKAWIKATGGSAGKFNQLLEKGGYSNILGEIGEEDLGAVLRAVVGVDGGGNVMQRLKTALDEEVFNLEQKGVQLSVLSLPLAGQSIANRIGGKPDVPITEPQPAVAKEIEVAPTVTPPKAAQAKPKAAEGKRKISEIFTDEPVFAADLTEAVEGEVSGFTGFPTKHPTVKNADGSESNVLLSGFEINGREYVIPTMVDGKKLTNKQAVEIAKQNGLENYPSFDTVEEANKFAEEFHDKIGEDGQVIGILKPTPTAKPTEAAKVKGKKLHEPKKGSREGGFISSAKEALPQLKVEGQYIPRSTDELAIKAKNLIIDDIKEAERVAKTGSNDKSVAVASELIKHFGEQAALATDEAARDLFYDKAAKTARDMAGKLTELGRAVQAASILSRLTPEGQLRFAAREIQKHNEKVEESRGGLFGLKKKIPELTPEQTKEILEEMKKINEMEPGEAKSRRFQKLQNKISSMVPTSLFQKAITVWKAGLLTGLKTSGLNIFSTASNVALETAAKIPATIIDKAISLGTGKRTVSVTIKGLGRGGVAGAKRGVDYLTTGYDERNIGTKLDYKRSNFGKGKVAEALQRYSDTVFRLLGAEDQPFYYAAKLRSLYEQAKVEAINKGLKSQKAQAFIDNLVENPTDEMVRNASKDAEAAVFQNKTALGDLGKQIQGLAGGAGEIVVPFARTPAAVAMQIVNYSPVGAIKTVLENIGKGRFDQRDLVTGLGKAAVGAIPLVIGAALYDEDMITLDFPKTEKERKLWEIEGRKANSVKIDGKWRTVQTIGPQGNLLVIGGHFRRAFQESGSPSEAMAEAIKGAGKSFTEQTFLQGINQFTSALSDPERSAPRLAGNLVSSVIPTIVGDIARATDPLERRAETIGERVKAKIPGARKTLEPRITVLGEELEATANPLEIMIDPTRPSKEVDKPVVKELRRLFDAGHSVTPSLLGDKTGFEILTQKENTNLWKRAGSIINETLGSVISNPAYKGWTDELKVEAIGRIVDAGKKVAKAEAVANQLKGLKGKDVTDKLIELSESGLMPGIPKKKIEKLKGDK